MGKNFSYIVKPGNRIDEERAYLRRLPGYNDKIGGVECQNLAECEKLANDCARLSQPETYHPSPLMFNCVVGPKKIPDEGSNVGVERLGHSMNDSEYNTHCSKLQTVMYIAIALVILAAFFVERIVNDYGLLN